MDCAGWVGHMFYRADVIDNVIGQVRRQNYLSGIQRGIEQGRSRVETVCLDCVIFDEARCVFTMLSSIMAPVRSSD
jgi:hypothetical protein